MPQKLTHRDRTNAVKALIKHKFPKQESSYWGSAPHRFTLPDADAAHIIWAILRKRPEIRDYLEVYRTCVTLRVPFCANCGERETMHVQDKCLFAATTYVEKLPPSFLNVQRVPQVTNE